MTEEVLLQLFILQLIDKHSLLDNQYGLTRFFAKSAILPRELYDTLNCLEHEELIRGKEVRSTVKYYFVTDKGKEMLAEKYSIPILKEYLHDIERTDFFITILEKIEKRY